MLCLRRVALRVCAIPSTSFTISSRPITSLTSSFRQSRIPRAAILPLQRRLVQNEAVQAERDADEVDEADGTEKSENGDNSISEGIHTEIQGSEHGISPSASLQDATASSSTDEGVPDELVHEATRAAPSDDLDLFNYGAPRSNSARDPESPYRRENIPPCATIYLGNINFDTTEAQISKHLEAAGQVLEVKLIKDARGFSRGFAYARFDNEHAATKAIEMFNDQPFDGRRATINYAKASGASIRRPPPDDKKDLPPSRTLFIGNMSYDMTDRDLNDLFSRIENVIDVRVAIDRRSGQPRGFAHAEFTDVESAIKGKEVLAGKEVCGRLLRIDFSGFKRGGRGEQQGLLD